MGRLTPASRDNFNEVLAMLRKEYQNALRDKGRRDAFNKLVSAWCSELGAFTYAESIPLIDLILLTSSIENRALLNELTERFNKFQQGNSKTLETLNTTN